MPCRLAFAVQTYYQCYLLQALLAPPAVRHTDADELTDMVAAGDSRLLFRMRNSVMELEMRQGTQFRRMQREIDFDAATLYEVQPELVLPLVDELDAVYVAETPVIYTTLRTVPPRLCSNYELFDYGGTAEQLSLITQNGSAHLERLNFEVMMRSESAQRIMEATAVQDECHFRLHELFDRPKMQAVKPVGLANLAGLFLLLALLLSLAGLVLLCEVNRARGAVVGVGEQWTTLTIRVKVGSELDALRQLREVYGEDVMDTVIDRDN